MRGGVRQTGMSGPSVKERKAWLLRLAGHTPAVPIVDDASGCTIWVKLEYLLPSGSTKDRVAAFILAHGVETNLIHQDSLVVEASSGSTSIAFAMACAVLGIRFRAVMPSNVSRERLLIIKRYGGEVHLTDPALGVLGAIEATRAMAAADANVFLPKQFENELNARAHQRETGRELIAQVGSTIHGFAAGVGTGGTLMGIARALREAGHSTHIVRAMPTRVSVCFGEAEVCAGCVPGVVEGLSKIMNATEIALADDVQVTEDDCVAAARELCGRGFAVGPSSGLNFAATRQLAKRLGPGHTLATVLCDRMERYFSTTLFDDVDTAPRPA